MMMQTMRLRQRWWAATTASSLSSASLFRRRVDKITHLPSCHHHNHLLRSLSSSSGRPIDANKDLQQKTDKTTKKMKMIKDDDGLTLSYFISKSASSSQKHTTVTASHDGQSTNTSSSIPMAANLGDEFDDKDYMVTEAMSPNATLDRLGSQMINNAGSDETDDDDVHTLRFHLKTYGCQMNVNDTDIVRSILLNNHHNMNSSSDGTINNTDTPSSLSSIPIKFIETDDEIQADVLLTNTCAIRENAEQKVWHRLRALRSHDRNFPLSSSPSSSNDDGTTNNNSSSSNGVDEISMKLMTKEQRKQKQSQTKLQRRKRIIGVLGCMAERLKEEMFSDGTADLVVGPDAYRDLPRLISVLSAPSTVPSSSSTTTTKKDGTASTKPTLTIPTERAVNVQLSLDETYASITPIRSNPHDVSAFVSIMRGCNNMCSYCVVPFTRGRERSRDMDSVVEETRRLIDEEGIKEVILLGQNVNSYHDNSGVERRKRKGGGGYDDNNGGGYQTSNAGFSNMFRLRHGEGYRFADLLDAVSALDPELRVRFTSPHPKDYPPALLTLMAERPNICNHLHMPAQSGSTTVLERMRRGYSREAYLDLIDDVRRLIPDVAISSDFISGFCGETENEHHDTISLMERVQFDQAFMFAYSMRGKVSATQKTLTLPTILCCLIQLHLIKIILFRHTPTERWKMTFLRM